MSCTYQYAQFICTPRQDEIFIHHENIVTYVWEYNEYQHPHKSLGSVHGNVSNCRMKQNKFPAVTNSCSLISSHSIQVSYLTAKTIATAVLN